MCFLFQQHDTQTAKRGSTIVMGFTTSLATCHTDIPTHIVTDGVKPIVKDTILGLLFGRAIDEPVYDSVKRYSAFLFDSTKTSTYFTTKLPLEFSCIRK